MKPFIILFLSLTAFTVSAQDNSEMKVVDNFMKRFNLKMDTVSWLCQYDDIAWWTSDSVYASSKVEQSKLGSEWFCFKQGSLWHALYGKYVNNQFQMVFHYEVDSNQIIKRVYKQVDSSTQNSYARALVNAAKIQAQFPDTIKVRFNQYIRKNDDKTISVWLLPAFTTSSYAVYGGEFYYLFDQTGNHLISKAEYSQGYSGFKTDPKKEIWLSYENLEEPTLGAIFFVWYYRRYFESIVVNAKKIKSTVFHDKEKGYYWVHAVK
jgi:hypothetical protein